MIQKESVLMLDLAARRSNSLTAVARNSRNLPAANLEVLPDAARLAFRGRPSAIQAAGEAFGIQLPQTACRFGVKGNRSAYWLGPDEWLLHATGERPSEPFAILEKALAGHSYSLVDVSHRSDAFALSGELSGYILNHGCPLDLSQQSFPVGMCTRTILYKATILLSRPRTDTFHIDVWRSFAPYVWQLLDEARSELA
jgi:sarcosine oxidase subunit gamma